MGLKKMIQGMALDKKEHIVIGVLYSSLIPFLAILFGDVGAFVGVYIGTTLNLYKELYNDFFRKKGRPEFLDFIATQVPIMVTLLAYLSR